MNRSFIIILICLIMGYVLYAGLIKYNSYIFGVRHFRYKDCKVKYRQECIEISSAFNSDNMWFRDKAECEFINCLCNDYVASKDTFIKNYVENAYKNDFVFQYNYIHNIKGLDTLILMHYKTAIFSDDEEGKLIIKRWNNDSIRLTKILSGRYYDDFHIQKKYINTILSIPSEQVPIDTLIKYKETIFIPQYYGDA